MSLEEYYHNSLDDYLKQSICLGGLSIIQLNAFSIRNKWDEFLLLIRQFGDVDIVSVCETWLAPNETEYFNIAGYESFFSCRQTEMGRGGGCAIC